MPVVCKISMELWVISRQKLSVVLDPLEKKREIEVLNRGKRAATQ